MEVQDREKRIASLAGRGGNESQRGHGRKGERNARRDRLRRTQLRAAEVYRIRQCAECGGEVPSGDSREHCGRVRRKGKKSRSGFWRLADERGRQGFVSGGELYEGLRGRGGYGRSTKPGAQGVLELGAHGRARNRGRSGIHGFARGNCGEGPGNTEFHPVTATRLGRGRMLLASDDRAAKRGVK